MPELLSALNIESPDARTPSIKRNYGLLILGIEKRGKAASELTESIRCGIVSNALYRALISRISGLYEIGGTVQ